MATITLRWSDARTPSELRKKRIVVCPASSSRNWSRLFARIRGSCRFARKERTRTRGERERAASEGRSVTLELDVPAALDEIERRAIEATLDYTGGDKTRAARALGIGRKTLYRKLQQYNGEAEEGGKG